MNRRFAVLVVLLVFGIGLTVPTPGGESRLMHELTLTRPEHGTVTSEPAGIDCGSSGSDCSEAFGEGEVVTLTAEADEWFTFGGWSDACSETSTCQLLMDASKTVTATFIPELFSEPYDPFGSWVDDTAEAVSAEGDAVYVVGYTSGSIEGANAGHYDAYLRRYFSAGAIQWTRQFGTATVDLANSVSAEGEAVYVAGSTYGSLEGPSAGGRDGFLRKYSSDGEMQWARQFGTTEDDYILSISAEGGAVYVAGFTEGNLEGISAGSFDAFIRKYTSDGDVAWTRQFGTTSDDTALSVAAGGEAIYVVGYTKGSLGGTITGERDAYLRKYTSDGEEEWTRQFGFPQTSNPASAVAVEDKTIYVVGSTTGSLGGENAGNFDVFLRKYRSDGEVEWTRQFGTAGFDSPVSVDVAGEAVYVVGLTEGSLETRAGGMDVFLRRYNSDGEEEWTKQFGSAEDDYATGVSVETDAVYVVGLSEGNLETHPDNTDAFLHKYSGAGAVQWTRQFGTSTDAMPQ